MSKKKRKPLASRLQKLPIVPEKYREEITVVTGMHRSGTSCIAGMLAACGLYPGLSNTMINKNTPQVSNEKGHFENYNMVVLNDYMLRAAGGKWKNPPPIKKIEEVGKVISNHISEFSKTFNGNLVKDPRLCLTLKVWKDWCPRIGKVVVCLRNPLSVAKSLSRRDGISIERGLSLWYEYNYRLMQNTDIEMIVVDYDELCLNTSKAIHNLLREIIPDILVKEDVIYTALSFFDKRLNHSCTPNVEDSIVRLPNFIQDPYYDLKLRAVNKWEVKI